MCKTISSFRVNPVSQPTLPPTLVYESHKSVCRISGLIIQIRMLLEPASYPSFRKIPAHPSRLKYAGEGWLLPPLATHSHTSHRLTSQPLHLPLDLKLSRGSDLPWCLGMPKVSSGKFQANGSRVEMTYCSFKASCHVSGLHLLGCGGTTVY